MSMSAIPTGDQADLIAALPVGVSIAHFPTDDPLDGYLTLANEAASAHLGIDLISLRGIPFRQQIEEDAAGSRPPDVGLQVSFEVAVSGGTRTFAEYEIADGDASGHYQSTVFGLPNRCSASLFRRIDAEVATSRALHWAMQSAETANAELAKFASTVAHDLKNPLAGISGYAQMLQMHREDLPAALQEPIDRVVELATLSSSMVDGLLRYAKKPTMVGTEKVDLVKVVGWVESVIAEELAAAEGTIHCHDLPEVDGNEAALRQVFLNLVTNSIRYRRDDRPLTITVSSTEPGTVRLVDSGRGIAADERDRVFEWGYRSPETSRTTGSGMGLAACRSVLQNLGGDIVVGEPPPSGGTTMQIMFFSG